MPGERPSLDKTMDWVKSYQIRSKRGLTKQIDQISEIQRLSEIQRDREMRDINLELQRFQKKSTRDLNEILQDRPTAARYERRSSLPVIYSDSPSSLNSLRIPGPFKDTSARTPRSRRRLSIAAGFPSPGTPEPSQVSPQPGPRLRRLSIDGRIPGLSPREALEAGGYKLTRSFTSVNRSGEWGPSFRETTQSLREVATLPDSHLDKSLSNQLTSVLLCANSRTKDSSKARSSASSSSRQALSPGSAAVVKTKDNCSKKLLSASASNLVDGKRTVTILQPLLPEQKSPTTPKRSSSDQDTCLGEVSSSCSAGSRSNSESSVLSENSKTEDIKKEEDSDQGTAHLNDKAENKEKLDIDDSSIKLSPPPLEAIIETTDAGKEATVTDNVIDAEKENSSEESSTGANPQEELKSPATACLSKALTETLSTEVEVMPGTRRESLKKSMEDDTDHPHKTTVFIHEDNTVLRVLDDGTVKAEEEIIEDKQHSMFVSRRSSRRLSEPAVGGQFLKELQERAHGELSVLRSIQENLPSDLVAEQDEEETEATTQANEKEEGVPLDLSDLKISEVSPRRQSRGKDDTDTVSLKLSSSPRSSKAESIKGNGKASKAKTSETDKERSNAVRQRRKSDGDVLRFAKVFKVKNQQMSSKAKKGEDRGNHAEEHQSEKDKVWEAVRKCRYIRGYEPPEIEDANSLDISEFVFGHRDPRSVVQDN